MRLRTTCWLLAMLVFCCSPMALAQVNNPQSPNSSQVQGPDPTGNQGYPFAVTPATGTAAFPVSGTFWQSIQPVSQSGTWTVQQGSPPWSVSGSGTFTVDASGHIIPVSQSGTWTVNQGSAPWSIIGTLTNNNAAPSSNNMGFLAALANAAVPSWTEGDQVLLSEDLSGRLRTLATISGTVGVTQSTSPWVVSGSGTFLVDGSGHTQPVSGTVTANAGTGTFTVDASGHTVPVSQSGTWTVQQGTPPWSVSQSGTWTNRIVGNTGATLDSTVGPGTAPANQVVVGSVYNSSAPAPTSGQAMALQADQAGNLRVTSGAASATLSVWNSSTALNATQNIFTNSGVPSVLVQVDQTTTITAGAITFEVTYDGTNWVTIPADCVVDPTSTTQATISLPYTLQASTNKPFLLHVRGAEGLRIKLSTAITGTGTVTPFYTLMATDGVYQVTAGGTLTVQGSKTNNNAAPDGGNVGVLPSIANASNPTYTEGDQTLLSVDLAGRLRTIEGAPSEAVSGYTASDITTTTSTQVVAGSVSKNLWITSILVTNMSGSVDTRVDLQDGSGGTAIYGGFAAHGGGGFSISIPFPGLKVPTSGNGLFAVCGTTGAQVRVSAAGISR